MEAKKKASIILVAFIVMVTTMVLTNLINESSPPGFKYAVQAGDTCAKVASNLGVSVISIIKANNLQMDCSNIYVGQVLTIPYPTLTPPGAKVATPQIIVECERAIYTAKEGDMLASVASQYEIPEEAIYFFNGLATDTVKPGTQLVIPLCYDTPHR